MNNCYICGSAQNTFYAEENGFHLVKCNECGLLFVIDRPADGDISQAHEQGLHRGDQSFSATGSYKLERVNWYKKVLVDLYGKKGLSQEKWLDVGCGHGEFMEAVQSLNSHMSVKGTEPNFEKQVSARSRGLDVSYFDLQDHNEKYDVVSLLNVFSHLPDPPSFIDSITRILKPNGELIIETGDSAKLIPDDHYRPFYLPDHLSFASQEIVVSLLNSYGFEILKIKKYPHPKYRFDCIRIIKEFLKMLLLNKDSKFRQFLLYSHTDMFIRARLSRDRNI